MSKSKPDITTVPEIVEAIAQVEAELRGEGRVLVRYSGTQNMCRVMVEGPTKEVTEKYCQLGGGRGQDRHRLDRHGGSHGIQDLRDAATSTR